jgi:uncharacterized protein (DUF111 family)
VLILAQIDDRSGEVLGRALEELMGLGARNVQLLNSVTKKGRPGTVLLIDVEPDLEPDVGAFLAVELGAWGYHVLDASHRHFDTVVKERSVTIICGDRRETFSMPCKFFSRGDRLLRVKAERTDVEAVQRFVSTIDEACSTDSVRSRVEDEVRRRPDAEELEVRLW